MSGRRRVAILISGRGSNMRALVEACASPDYPAEVAVVISNIAGAAGLKFAQDAGIPTETIPHKDYAERDAFDAALDEAIGRHKADFVCLAGFMRLLGPAIIERWRDRMINIHPSLLPSFRGLDTHRRALDAGVKIAGCTVHCVRHDTDTGPIIAQAAVPVRADDTEDSLAARILEQEHKLYPLALRLLAEGHVIIEGDRAIVRGTAPETVMQNPCPL